MYLYLDIYFIKEVLVYPEEPQTKSNHFLNRCQGLTAHHIWYIINTSTAQGSLHFLTVVTPHKPRPLGCINHVSNTFTGGW